MAAEKGILLDPFSNWTNLVHNISLDLLPRNEGPGVSSAGGAQAQSPSSSSEGTSEWVTCHNWQDAQHTLFQLANLCAAVSLLTPSSFRHHFLFLRCLLLVAYLLFVLWAGLFVCMLDVLIWNCLFFLVDFAHIVCLAYSNIPSRFNSNLNELYTKRMKPLRVSRKDFAEFCNVGNVLPLRKGARYAVENVTQCGEKVSVLLRGRLKATHDGIFLHLIEPNEFIDSIEFDSVPFHADNHHKSQVTITASEDSLLISWLYPSLRVYFASNPFIWAVFTNLVGKDVSDKLYRIQELLLRRPEDMHSALMSRNSSMVNVIKCLHTPDGQRLSFANASAHTPEPAVSPGSLQMAAATVETSV